jgi:hypothetical protein
MEVEGEPTESTNSVGEKDTVGAAFLKVINGFDEPLTPSRTKPASPKEETLLPDNTPFMGGAISMDDVRLAVIGTFVEASREAPIEKVEVDGTFLT